MTAKIKLNAASGGGSFSLQAPSSSANNRVFTIPDVADGTIATTATAGKILQVKQTVKTSFFSTTSTSSDGVEITGLNVAITPTSSSNKILISCSGYYGNGNNDSFASLFLARQIDSGSTDTGIAVGDARGSAKRATMSASLRNGGGDSSTVCRYFGCEFLDSPNTTGVCTYKIFMVVTQGTPACIGGTETDGDANHQSYPTFITAKEVAA